MQRKPDPVQNFKDQARQLAKSLSLQNIVVEEDGIKIVIDGNQKIKEFSVEGVSNSLVVEKLNKAISLAQAKAGKELTKTQLT